MLAFDDAQAAVARPDTAMPLPIASRPDSALLLVLTASPRKAAAPVEPAAPPSIGPASASPRLQVEAAVFVSDRQPSRASRLASATQSGVITQTGPTQITGPITPPPPPAFPTPVAGDPATGVFVANGVSALREGSIANVRGWSSGLDLGVRFAPDGLDDARWIFRLGLSTEASTTKSETASSPNAYESLGTPALSVQCQNIAVRVNACTYTRMIPTTRNVLIFPSIFPGQVEPQLAQDALKQSGDLTQAHFAFGRALRIASPVPDLVVNLGGEFTGGWWSVKEAEVLVGSGPALNFFRKVDGPTASVQATAALSGRFWGPLAWSLYGAAGRQSSDLTYSSHIALGGADVSSRIDHRSTQTIGRLGGRLDYAAGPWNAFVQIERRRDPAIVTTLTGLGAVDRSPVRFADGSAAGVWSTYSSRATFGIGRRF